MILKFLVFIPYNKSTICLLQFTKSHEMFPPRRLVEPEVLGKSDDEEEEEEEEEVGEEVDDMKVEGDASDAEELDDEVRAP